MADKFKMLCGCEFDVDEKGDPLFNDKIEDLPDCRKVWDLIAEGNTIGCFQIESRLGRQVCKKVRPDNMEELADVNALIRPSCLEAKLGDGKNIMEHYASRKNGLEKPETISASLEPILADTKMLLLYQESMIKIMQQIGGFSESESDDARRAAGKKKADLMAKIKIDFIEGALKVGKVDKETAENIFDWIEKSQRYSFNKSHAVSYAYISYGTAYAKSHFPTKFFRSYLDHSKDKTKPLEELNRIVMDARKNGVNIMTPDIRQRNKDFKIDDKKIYFGINHIKNIGEKVSEDIINAIPDNIESLSWNEFLLQDLIKMRKSAIKILLACGTFDFMGQSRKKMLYEHDKLLSIKESELKYIIEKCDLKKDSLESCLQELCKAPTGKNKPISNKRRLAAIQDIYRSISKPSYSLKDSIEEISSWEETYLGISITCSKFDLIRKSGMETDCVDFEKEYDKKFVVIGQIKRIREIVDKNDNEMAFCTISDSSGEIDSCVVFKDKWLKYKDLLKNMNILKLVGFKSEDSFILTFCEEVNR